jgi:aquaporin Z
VAMMYDGAAPLQAGGGRRQLLRSSGTRDAMLHDVDSWDRRYGHLLRVVRDVLPHARARAVAGGMGNARSGGSAVPYGILVVAPALDDRAYHPVCWRFP